ncbi:Ig-like domain-containing protein [bacterium]|nr:Ig-like domain-containing protein [bacterium]
MNGATSDGGETVTISGTVHVNVAGDYALSYNASDAAGNAATEVTRTVTVADTTAPVVPTLTGPVLTNSATPTLTGTAEAGSTVKVYEGNTALGQATADASDGSFSITVSALTDGSRSITATATDTGATLFYFSSWVSNNESYWGTNRGLGGNNQLFDGNTFTGNSGTVINIGPDASDGITNYHDALTTITNNSFQGNGVNWTGAPADTSGNTEVDTTPPAAPTLTGAVLSNSATPTLTGTAEAGSTVKVYEGGTELGQGTTDGNGGFSIITTSTLAEGSHDITATATDAANNTSVSSGAHTVVVDTTVPVITLLPPAYKTLDDLVDSSLTNSGNGSYHLVSNFTLNEHLIIESNETLFIDADVVFNIAANVYVCNKGIVFLTGTTGTQTTINNYGIFINKNLINSSKYYEYFYNNSGPDSTSFASTELPIDRSPPIPTVIPSALNRGGKS